MNDGSRLETLERRLVDVLGDLLSIVPGAHVEGIPLARHRAGGRGLTDRNVRMTALIRGWGPTFHMRRFHWSEDMGRIVETWRNIESGMDAESALVAAFTTSPTPDVSSLDSVEDDEVVAAFRRHASAHVAAQAEIAACGARLGFDVPIPYTRGTGTTRVGHIAIDGTTVDALRHVVGGRLETRVVGMVQRLLWNDGEEGPELHIHARPDDPGSMTCKAVMRGGSPHLLVRVPIGTGHLMGAWLTCPAALPDSILAAAPGRRCDCVIRTGVPAIDEATIVEARANDDDADRPLVSIRLATRTLTLSDAIREDAA